MPSGKYKKTPEHCKNLSLARKGIVFSAEHKKNLSLAHLGHKPIISKETYKIIALKNTGKKRTEENKAKLRITRARQIMRPKTIEERLHLSKARKNNPNWHTWKGGITPINRALRQGLEANLWREAVFARDNWTCQKTNIRGGSLVVHHIQNFSQWPELRFALDNGITLSKQSHKEFHSIYGTKNNTREQLIEFLNGNK
jgi:hypothetical protein